MKRFFAITFFLQLAASVFCYDGAALEHKKLLVHKTLWFDIIYAKENEQTAKILSKEADTIYQQAAEQYGITPQCRMPVVITQKVEQFNANWSSFPYNHIVIYDTAVISDLQVFEDTLFNTFRHEITHSITYNMKNKFWKGVSSVFGDAIYPGSLTITRGMAEGAAVASESVIDGGEHQGRLNDEFAKHSVKQAKIEGKFPEYHDVQGASDKYPAGSFYTFNSAFHQWLQKKYGLEKYAQFWYRLINLHSISAGRAFKKVYGINLSSAWKNFKDEYKICVPESQENPVESKIARDFFLPDEACYSPNNEKGALYSSLKKSENGIYYLDEKNDSVFYCESNSLPRKLFTLSNIRSIDVSKDGRFISCIYYSHNKSSVKSELAVFDTETASLKKLSSAGSNIHEAVVLCSSQNEYFIAAKKYDSPVYKISLYKTELSKSGKIKNCAEYKNLTLPYGTDITGLALARDSDFAFIKKSGLSYSLCAYSKECDVVFETPFPANVTKAKYISYDSKSDCFYFSWAEKDSMPRLGLFDLKKHAFYLDNKDISGGIFSPIMDSGKNQIIFIGNFYRQNRILTMESPELSDSQFIQQEITSEKSEKAGNSNSETYEENSPFESKPYNRLNYLRGIIFPFSLCSSNSYNYGYKSNWSLPLGITYINSNPWSAGVFQASAGYGLATNSFAVQASYSSGTFTELFKWNCLTGTEFDGLGWKQANGQLKFTSQIPFGRISNIILSDSILLHYGRSNLTAKAASDKKKQNNSEIIGYAKPLNTKNYFYAANSLSAGYSNIHLTGDGRYSYGGFSIFSVYSVEYNADDKTDLEKYDFYNNLGFYGTVRIPRLIPVRDYENLTCNLPSQIGLNLIAKKSQGSYSAKASARFINSDFPEFDAASAQFSTILFGAEIQKGAGILFFNHFHFVFDYKIGFSFAEDESFKDWKIAKTGDYLKKLSDGEVPLEQYFGLKSVISITPNWGITANSLAKSDFYGEIGIGLKDSKVSAAATIGVNLNL